MNTFIVPLILLFTSHFLTAFSQDKDRFAATKYENEGYHLVWADEFNDIGSPKAANWKFEEGFVRNKEEQWYQKENAWCEGGLLIIEARKEDKPNPNYVEGSEKWNENRPTITHTSSSINTRDLHSWQYGRFEMRGRINISAGLWPAFWTLGIAKQWPSNGEIDIMEYYKGNILANIACGTEKPYQAKWYSKTKPVKELGGEQWAADFHTWRMDWDEEAIALYVDDMLLNKVALEELVNRDGTGFNPFKQPHYILLNLAMGGINGGELGDTEFPNRFEVDYVRVYQKRQ
ncbi:family 16 glycosylhydrolase [Olivibacter sp. XZL3]|uniref:glycoside hydrolase family 16 protein n=1 Tax=Olivibacter sp. XZL3 TaxID=1735116 RepID=UPI001066CC72|nr:glycoside hydrolase family 16 protein [Olivibacter sp. XZL3]